MFSSHDNCIKILNDSIRNIVKINYRLLFCFLATFIFQMWHPDELSIIRITTGRNNSSEKLDMGNKIM